MSGSATFNSFFVGTLIFVVCAVLSARAGNESNEFETNTIEDLEASSDLFKADSESNEVETNAIENLEASFDLFKADSESNEVETNTIEDLEASPELFPYFVTLAYKNVPICAGAIVSREHVLVAARCARKAYPKAMAIHTLAEPDVPIGIKNMKPHPVLNVTLIRVNREFNLDSPDVQSIKLYHPSSPFFEKMFSVIVGVDRERTGYSKFMMAMTVDRETCSGRLQSAELGEGYICMGSFEHDGEDECPSEAGSILTIDGELAGIAAFPDCGSISTIGVFIEMSSIYDWVEENTRPIFYD